MIHKNIFAFTDTLPEPLPAFISVNTPEDKAYQRVRFSVRSRGEQYAHEIELTFHQCRVLADAILMHLEKPNDTTN